MKSIAWLTLAVSVAVMSSSFAGEEAKPNTEEAKPNSETKPNGENDEKLFQLLSEQKLTMQEGIKKALDTTTDIPIAARFAINKEGDLVLRVLACENGFQSDVDQAGLKLYTTCVDPAKWKPETKSINAEHMLRASECWTLLAVSRDSLFDILERAEKDHHDIIYAVGPSIREGKAEFILSVDSKGKKEEARYTLKAKK